MSVGWLVAANEQRPKTLKFESTGARYVCVGEWKGLGLPARPGDASGTNEIFVPGLDNLTARVMVQTLSLLSV